MRASMATADGVGLAAPQIGVGVVVVVLPPAETGGVPVAPLNPQVVNV